MAHTALVGLDIEAGAAAIDALEHAGVPISVGIWMATSDNEDGRVFVASPSFDEGDLRAAYDRVVTTLYDRLPQNPPSVGILRMSDPVIRDLEEMFARSKPASGKRFGGQMVGGRFIAEGYVYKIT